MEPLILALNYSIQWCPEGARSSRSTVRRAHSRLRKHRAVQPIWAPSCTGPIKSCFAFACSMRKQAQSASCSSKMPVGLSSSKRIWIGSLHERSRNLVLPRHVWRSSSKLLLHLQMPAWATYPSALQLVFCPPPSTHHPSLPASWTIRCRTCFTARLTRIASRMM